MAMNGHLAFTDKTNEGEITGSIFVCILLDGEMIYSCPEKVVIDYNV